MTPNIPKIASWKEKFAPGVSALPKRTIAHAQLNSDGLGDSPRKSSIEAKMGSVEAYYTEKKMAKWRDVFRSN